MPKLIKEKTNKTKKQVKKNLVLGHEKTASSKNGNTNSNKKITKTLIQKTPKKSSAEIKKIKKLEGKSTIKQKEKVNLSSKDYFAKKLENKLPKAGKKQVSSQKKLALNEVKSSKIKSKFIAKKPKESTISKQKSSLDLSKKPKKQITKKVKKIPASKKYDLESFEVTKNKKSQNQSKTKPNFKLKPKDTNSDKAIPNSTKDKKSVSKTSVSAKLVISKKDQKPKERKKLTKPLNKQNKEIRISKKSSSENGARFKIGDFVVYPSHGVGNIKDIESISIADKKIQCFLLHFEKERLSVKVPIENAEKFGLRNLVSKSVMEEVMVTLRSGVKKLKGMWSRRAQEYETKINSGDIMLLAEVLRDLTRDIEDSERSFSERIIYETAIYRLASEYSVIYNVSFEEAKEKIINTAKDKISSDFKIRKDSDFDDFDFDDREIRKDRNDDDSEEEEDEEDEEDEDDFNYKYEENGDLEDEEDEERPRKKKK